MSEITDYYGHKRGTTYLEIYSVFDDAPDRRTVHRQLRDQEAYDTWHLALYFKEVLAYRELRDRGGGLGIDELPRKEKNLLMYLLLSADRGRRSVVELGSSLFEMIDGLELCDRYFAERAGSGVDRVDPAGVSYIGVEISPMLGLASGVLHPGHRVQVVRDCDRAPARFDVLYDRNVSSYAFLSPERLGAFINRSGVALMNLFVSRGPTFVSARLGKSLTYFGLRELIAGLDKPLYHLFGERAPGPHAGAELSQGRDVVEGFFLCASPEAVDGLMRTAAKDAGVRRWFEEKRVRPRLASELL